METISFGESSAYYRGVLTALRYLEHRRPTGRRFGPEADLRWSSFRGHLLDIDRVELMVRDADAEWPGAFGARRVFALREVAEDESFGQDWEPFDPVRGAELWRDAVREAAPADLEAAFARIALAWRLPLVPFDVGAIGPSTRLVAAGPSAVAALAQRFQGDDALDWADQVAVVATDPAARQLAAFAGAAADIRRPAVLLAANEPPPASLRGRALLVSPDAADADRAWAEALVRGT